MSVECAIRLATRLEAHTVELESIMRDYDSIEGNAIYMRGLKTSLENVIKGLKSYPKCSPVKASDVDVASEVILRSVYSMVRNNGWDVTETHSVSPEYDKILKALIEGDKGRLTKKTHRVSSRIESPA